MIFRTIDIATVKGVDVTNLLRMRTVFKGIDNADIKRADATKWCWQVNNFVFYAHSTTTVILG